MNPLPIVDAAGLADAVDRLRAGPEGRRTIAWTNGCFDLFHHGHLSNLSACAEEADVLVVGVNGDESVRRLKGDDRPVVPGVERMALVAALQFVDLVVPLDADEPSSLILAARPDVVAVHRPKDLGGGILAAEPGDKTAVPFFQLSGVFYFDADGVLVEALPFAPDALTGVPADGIKGQQLGNGSVPADDQMGRNLALGIAQSFDRARDAGTGGVVNDYGVQVALAVWTALVGRFYVFDALALQTVFSYPHITPL